MKKVSPTNDLALRKVFASTENKDILQGLIEDFYEIEPLNLAIENPYSISDYKELLDGKEIYRFRETVKDISASFNTADFVSECQVRSAAFFDERAIFYPLDRFCKNYNKYGEMQHDTQGRPFKYSSLRPVYALNILGYTHFQSNGNTDDDDAFRIFEIYDVKNQRRYKKDLIKIGFFELTKNHGLTVNQESWLEYFKTGTARAGAPDYIKKASSIIEFSNLAEEERNVITALEKWENDRQAEIHYGFLEGRHEGLLEGLLEGQNKKAIEFAKAMLKNGEAKEKIALYTGLAIEDIQSL